MPASRTLVPAFAEALPLRSSAAVESRARRHNSGSPFTHRGSQDQLTYLGISAEEWLSRLFNRNNVTYDRFDELDDSPREQIYTAVAAFGERILPDLERALNRRREDGREAALQVIVRLGKLGEQMLTAAATNPRGNVRAEAITSLARHFPTAVELPALLLAALDDDVPDVRQRAADSLGPAGPSVKPALIKALRHADPIVRRQAARQIRRIDPNPTFAEPLLIELLADADLEVRWAAVQELRCQESAVLELTKVLVQLIEEGLLAAVNCLPSAGPEGLKQALSLLETENLALRASAAEALAEYVCGGKRNPPEAAEGLGEAEAREILLACQRVENDNDLAVRIPAGRIVAALNTICLASL